MQKGEAARREILDQALQAASRIGLGGLTIGSLAEQTGRSKSGVFAHFRSKEELQLQVLEHAIDHFTEVVIRPSLTELRGEPRVRALFHNWLRWDRDALAGGCIFIQATVEFDDQPGKVRDRLVSCQRDWIELIAQVFTTGIKEGHVRPEADAEQFAHDLNGVMLAYQYHRRLLRDPHADQRAEKAFEALLAAAREPAVV